MVVEIADLQAHSLLWANRSGVSSTHDYHDYDKINVILSNNWQLDNYVIIVIGLAWVAWNMFVFLTAAAAVKN